LASLPSPSTPLVWSQPATDIATAAHMMGGHAPERRAIMACPPRQSLALLHQASCSRCLRRPPH
jgi:hypothetical protein